MNQHAHLHLIPVAAITACERCDQPGMLIKTRNVHKGGMLLLCETCEIDYAEIAMLHEESLIA